MNYISLDLEFNGAFDFERGEQIKTNNSCRHEIIQIGAVKMDENREIKDRFNAYIKPVIYPRLNPFIADVINMKTEDFKDAGSFKTNFRKFRKFLSGEEAVFVVWGDSDLPVLYENISFYKLNSEPLILKYINIQPYISRLLNKEAGQQISLKRAIEALEIKADEHFHDALYDAYYTAKIFQITEPQAVPLKIFCSSHYKNLK
ncbi:MAG: exonuclease domain-containing protein [Clostridiales bacterium]|nr:exonuclease domain-containing protein [Clostridiales bacterium]